MTRFLTSKNGIKTERLLFVEEIFNFVRLTNDLLSERNKSMSCEPPKNPQANSLSHTHKHTQC